MAHHALITCFSGRDQWDDPDRGARLTRSACQRLEAFTPEAMASHYRTLYAQLLKVDTA